MTRTERTHVSFLGAALAGLSFAKHGAVTLGHRPALHLGFRALTGRGKQQPTHRPPAPDDGDVMTWGLG